MDGVVDRVKVQRLCALGKVGLARGRAVLGFDAHFKVLFGGIGHDFAKELRELCRVLGFLIRRLLPIEADLRVALAECDARHRKVHADLGALALEIVAKVRQDVLGHALRDADDMLRRPRHFAGLLLELRSGRLALRAALRRGRSFVYVTANHADPLFVHL